MSNENGKTPAEDFLASTLGELAIELIKDYRELKAGKITVRQARARAAVAREAMRAVSLGIEGLMLIAKNAKPVGVEDKRDE